ncbi:MAG TPA: hypothetical protein VF011_21295 [Terriglobales bacterium]
MWAAIWACSQAEETPARANRRCISKEGDAYLRTPRVQGAQHILGPFGPEKRAIIATAWKLAVLLHRLWASGEVYEPLRNRQQLAMAA